MKKLQYKSDKSIMLLNQNSNNALFLLALIFCFMNSVNSGSIPYTSAPTNIFIIGRISIIPTNVSATTINQITTVTHSTVTITPLRPILGILSFNIGLHYSTFFTQITISSYNASQFRIRTNCLNLDNSFFLTLNYMTLRSSFNSMFCTQTLFLSHTMTGSVSVNFIISPSLFCNIIYNTTHDNKILIFLNGLNLTSSSASYLYEISSNPNINSTNSTYQLVTISSNTITYYQAIYSYIVFDKTSIQKQGKYFFQSGFISASNNLSASISTPAFNPYFSDNYFFGLIDFKFSAGNDRLQFQSTQILNNTKVDFTMAQYTSIRFNYFLIKSRICLNSTYPYFNRVTALCYDDCGDGYYNNNNISECISCFYTCLDCTNSSGCTSCSNSSYRYLNGTSCFPIQGYFDDGNFIAKVCTINLVSCAICNANGSACTKCMDGYYLNGITCIACNTSLVNCIMCSSSTVCTQCSNTTFLSGNNCIASCSTIRIYQNTITRRCTSCYYTCYTCSNGVDCLTCSASDNRILVGNSCIPIDHYYDNNATVALVCSSNCFKCSSFSFCLSCNGTYLYTNNTCVSDCGARFYNEITDYTCKPCNYQCYDCLNSISCSSCSASDNRYQLNNSCPALDGYYDGGVTLAIACVSPCVNCLSATRCLTCINTHYLLYPQICDLCSNAIGNCSTCLSRFVCTSCLSGYQYVFNSHCFSDCGDRLYNYNATMECLPCHYSCLDCDNTSICTSCSILDNRQWDGSNCVPISQYYQSGTTVAARCVSPCNTCSNSITCLSCINGYYYIPNQCFLCSNDILGCYSCINSSVCSQCYSGYNLNYTSLKCDCYDTHCNDCVGIPGVCMSCKPGWKLENGGCQEVCGDGIMIGSQFCDDGNNVNLDGCSIYCKIQQGFICTNNIITSCKYNSTINLTLIYMSKSPTANTVTLQFKLNKVINSFLDTNFSDYISTDIPASQQRITYNHQTGEITLTIDYNQSIQSTTGHLYFTSSGIYSLTPNFTLPINLQSYDNLNLQYYPQSTYQLANIISTIIYASTIIMLFTTFLSIFGNKMIGIEGIAVLQLSYFGLINLNNLSPTIASLLNLEHSNLFNNLSDPLVDNNTPYTFRALSLMSNLIDNLNLNLGLLMVLFVGALVFILLKKCKKEKQQQYQKLSNKLKYEYTFTVLMFSAYLYAISLSIQVIYGLQSINNKAYLSLIVAAIMLLLYIIHFIFMIRYPQLFGEFTNGFDRTSHISCRYYNYLMIDRFLVGMCLVGIRIHYRILIPIILCFLQMSYVSIAKPYIKKHNNIRVVLNMGILLLTLGSYFFFSISSGDSTICIFLPLAIAIALLICSVYNMLFALIDIYQEINQRYNDMIAKKEEEDKKLMEFRQGIASLNQANPINLTKANQNQRKIQYPLNNISFLQSPKNKQYQQIKETQIQKKYDIYDFEYDSI